MQNTKSKDNRKKIRELVKEKYLVDELWSWSRYNTYLVSPYEYYLKYIKRVKETRENIYLTLGSITHEILEDYYNKKTKYEDMAKIYKERIILDVEFLDKKFQKDEKKDEKIRDKYINSCINFFENHKPLEGKVLIEQPLAIEIGNECVFLGYVDVIIK